MFYFKSYHFVNERGPLTITDRNPSFKRPTKNEAGREVFQRALKKRGGRNQQSQGQIGLNIEYPLAVLEISDLVFLD